MAPERTGRGNTTGIQEGSCPHRHAGEWDLLRGAADLRLSRAVRSTASRGLRCILEREFRVPFKIQTPGYLLVADVEFI